MKGRGWLGGSKLKTRWGLLSSSTDALYKASLVNGIFLDVLLLRNCFFCIQERRGKGSDTTKYEIILLSCPKEDHKMCLTFECVFSRAFTNKGRSIM